MATVARSLNVVGGGVYGGSGGASLFTTASNQYAIISFQSTGGASLTVSTSAFTGTADAADIYVGPSTSVSVGATAANASWVIFQNT